ncbi:GNAT family N-acetyltransferase [Maricaulis parjimensis]|uniref:GNAT family N-acetyltransferase n=1 Tax=Maricaulis parjimensis TaxID=144023 RepID=UPI001939BEAB|nr:GNAT family N-acetyltransferase [Maricaulis parjimensis]
MGKIASDLRVRPAKRSDLDAIDAIETACFDQDRFPRRNLRRMLSVGRTCFWLASVDDQDAGYAAVCFRRGTGIARLYSLAVLPGQAGQGVGQALLDVVSRTAIQKNCRALRLEVRQSNIRAIKLYERLGFRLISARPSYYEDGETALRYERILVRPADRVQETDPL